MKNNNDNDKIKSIKNVVGYVRVSTVMQAEEGFSIDAQQHSINEECKKNEYSLKKIFIDAGKSGANIEQRDDFKSMMSYLETHKDIDAVIVYKLSRISRKVSDLSSIVDFLEKRNIVLLSISENINTSNSIGKAFIYMSGIFAELERDNIIDTCRTGMSQRARDGKFNGGRVYGYESVKDEKNKDSILIIVKEEAEVVREIYNLYTIDFMGLKRIANHLNSKGVHTRMGNEWTIFTVKELLKNPIYKGFIRWGKHKDWNKKRRKGVTEDYILVKGIHEAIVTEQLWDETEKLCDIKSIKPTRIYEGNYILTGVLKCPLCGAPMVSSRRAIKNKPGEFHRYYMCNDYNNKGSSVCKSNLVHADKAEEYVIENIKDLIYNIDIEKALIDNIGSKVNVDIKDLEEELKRVNKEYKDVITVGKKYFDLFEKGDIDSNVLTERINGNSNKKNLLEDKMLELGDKIKNQNENIVTADMIKNVMSQFNTVFKNAEIGLRKELIRLIIEEIKVNFSEDINERNITNIKYKFEPWLNKALNSYSSKQNNVSNMFTPQEPSVNLITSNKIN